MQSTTNERNCRTAAFQHRSVFVIAALSAFSWTVFIAQPAAALDPAPALPNGAAHPATEGWNSASWQGDWLITNSTTHAEVPYTLPGGDGDAGLRLTLPAGANQSPSQGSEVSTQAKTGRGWYGARMQSANCADQPDAGVKTGLFTYFKDAQDRDGNGIEDNSEIDVEFLCSEPSVIHLTLYTDYQPPSSAGGEKMRKVNRSVDLRTGSILRSACYKESFEQPECGTSYAGEHNPTSVPSIEGFNSATGFWDYAFNWHDSGVDFYIYDKNKDAWVQIWDYRGPTDRVPSLSGNFLHNVWWNEAWKDEHGGGGQSPAVNTDVYIDYSFWPKQ